MQLLLASTGDAAVQAGYHCACGCRPTVTLERGAEAATDVCCCGTRFVVGARAEDRLEPGEGQTVEVQEFDAPWGEVLEAAWAVGGTGSHHHH